ncbi:MAG: YceI family protein [Gammaproteobacteria bacterium]|nr:YceI family protein [Gammaproteobacteria bacterium]
MFRKVLFSVCILFFAGDACAGWYLDRDSSSVTFVSVKKSSVAEVHHFGGMRGSINDQGKIRIEISLASVETYVPIRNERMKTLLFEAAKFPKAAISATVDPRMLSGLKVGEPFAFSTTMTLELHGKTHDLAADVALIKLADGSLMALSATPIIVNADDFGLGEGIERLRDIAKLSRIATAVPVTFHLTFDPDKP